MVLVYAYFMGIIRRGADGWFGCHAMMSGLVCGAVGVDRHVVLDYSLADT
jgi:hypothetical protein